MQTAEGDIELSIIMPALNEEANIAAALERTLAAFAEHGLRGEIVVVNDGSTDSTPRIVEEFSAARPGVEIRMIHHKTPEGLGAAFRDGLAEARGEAVAFMPGDDENDPSEITRYFGLLDQVDMVVPFVYNREVRSKQRNMISSLFRMLVNLTFGVNFNYTNGTVLYRRAILADSPNRSSGFFFQTENVVRAARRGYLYAEVPYRLDVRGGGESKALSWRSLKRVARDYLSLFNEVYFKQGAAGLSRNTVSAARRKNQPI